MLALLTIPAVMSMVLASNPGTENTASSQGFVDVLSLPPWVYTVGGAVIFLGLLAVTFGFRSTGKRH